MKQSVFIHFLACLFQFRTLGDRTPSLLVQGAIEQSTLSRAFFCGGVHSHTHTLRLDQFRQSVNIMRTSLGGNGIPEENPHK